MMKKINNKISRFNFFNSFIWLLLICLLIYSRFINLGWGLPYLFHPDERNMAVAIQQLKCEPPVFEFNFSKSILGSWEPVTNWIKVLKPFDIFNCFNPHFFAYGQFSLYLGYLLVFIFKLFNGNLQTAINLQEAIYSLRFISAIFSILTAVILIKIINLFINKDKKNFFLLPIIFIFIIFSPYAIQFSHFGTTESLLMFFYIYLIYLSLLFVERRSNLLSYVINSGFIVGVVLATKVSSLVFASIPLIVIVFQQEKKFSRLYSFFTKIFDLFIFILISILMFIIFSPHNFLNWQEFLAAIRYESDVALGKYSVFYTRQFIDTIPLFFQLKNIFPYAMGFFMNLIGFAGLIFIDWKDKKINFLRLAFFLYLIPNIFIFVKWTRFMAPIFPILTIFAVLFILNIKNQIAKLDIKNQKIIYFSLLFFLFIISYFLILPGVKYLFLVYLKPDIRFQATDWINKNIAPGSYVLSETANVVDIPLINENNLEVISFNFYDLDSNLDLQEELKNHLEKADYIFIPSRRIFANHPKNKYPVLAEYYENLFSGKLAFEKIAEFSSGLNDEQAEETWSVFDHPTIRIYRKNYK